MEHQIVMHVIGMETQKNADDIIATISAGMPGVEFIKPNLRDQSVTVVGCDMDRMQMTDLLEQLGFTVVP